jgi:hypothetical protein
MKVPEDPDNSTNHHTDTAAITDTDTFIFFPIVIIVHISTRRDYSYKEHNTITPGLIRGLNENEQS